MMTLCMTEMVGALMACQRKNAVWSSGGRLRDLRATVLQRQTCRALNDLVNGPATMTHHSRVAATGAPPSSAATPAVLCASSGLAGSGAHGSADAAASLLHRGAAAPVARTAPETLASAFDQCVISAEFDDEQHVAWLDSLLCDDDDDNDNNEADDDDDDASLIGDVMAATRPLAEPTFVLEVVAAPPPPAATAETAATARGHERPAELLPLSKRLCYGALAPFSVEELAAAHTALVLA